MTNNPTIDGVSLKRGDRLFHRGNGRNCDRGWVEYLCDEGCGDVRVRHREGAVPCVKLADLQWHAMTDEEELEEFYSELNNGGKLSKRALCHIRALQSIIAQLQVESGRGEADAWALLNGGGLIRDLTDRWDVAKHWDGIVEALYFAPPAPVAVEQFANELIDGAFEGGNFDGGDIQDIGVKHGLLSIETRDEPCGEFCACKEYGFPAECYRKTACLDATAALNTPQPAEWHDVAGDADL